MKGEYDQGLEYFQKALAIQIKQLGPNHPDVAISYNNIGSIGQVLYRKGEYDQALEYYQKALAIQIKQLGPNHPNVATSYNNIGQVHYRKGEYDKTLEWWEKAAELGNVISQAMTGKLYAMNPKLKNPIEAIKWYTIAQRNGFNQEMPRRDALAKKMTPEQITKAEALAKEMIEKNPILIRNKKK